MSRCDRRAGVGLVLAAAAVALASCDRKAAEAPPVRPVLSLVVQPKTEDVFGPFTGTVQPRYTTDLGFRAAGRMVSRNANVGDRVKQGDVLASLDPTVAQFNVAAAKADVANSQATLANTAGTQQRKAILRQTGTSPQSDLDTAVANQQAAQAKLNQSQANLVKANEQLDYTQLHSDFDGVIAAWSVEVGQVVSAGQTVVTVVRPDVRDGVFDVPDDLIAKVQPGARFNVLLQADASFSVAGEVREIAPAADAATRTRRIRLTLIDAPEAFRLGTNVAITLTQPRAPLFTVPATAILDRDGKANVWLVTSGNTASMKPVALGARQGEAVTVTEGLDKGDRVITAGVHSLAEGQPIKLLEP